MTSKERRKARRLAERPILTCSRCGVTDKTVKLTTNAYSVEIHGDDSKSNLCDNCLYDMAQEV